MSTIEQVEPAVNGASVRIERVEGDVMAVNSYLVHGPSGLVVVDAQLTVSDAQKVRDAVLAAGRPLAGVIVTHPHPDHYAGAAIIAVDAPILATAAVDAVIRRDDALKAEVVGPMMGSEWPDARRFPDRLVAPGQPVEVGGLTWQVTEHGPGESHVDTVWALDPRTVFIGDLVYSDMHGYLADGHAAAWLATLARLGDQLPDDVVLYPGHGAPTGRVGLAAQQHYVDSFLAVLAEVADDRAVVERMRQLTTDQRLSFLMELSIEPVRDQLALGGRA